jgi:membrane associated rhomboid family serine protease
MNDEQSGPMTVHVSQSREDCEERAFMLAAVGIDSEILHDGWRHELQVSALQAEAAIHHLAFHERERRVVRTSAPQFAPSPPLHRGAWQGCVVYVAVLVGVARLLSAAPAQTFARGTLDGELVQAGQWWRAWTALTLHWDASHLVANLGAGVWFGFFAARQIGVGTAWLLIVTGAAAANLFDAALGPASYRSAGASTAVFTALGVLAAHSWRSRLHLPQRWALRWAPLIGGAILLGWFGSAGEGTDLVAHALGFACGCLLGVAVAMPAVAGLFRRLPQWLSGAAALGSIALAWWRALQS